MVKISCTIEVMRMRILDKVKEVHSAGGKVASNYNVAKRLREIGIEITTQGIDQYDKEQARSMRLDVLVGLKRLSGLNWEKFGKMLEEEFSD